jgi:fatty acid kinase fatty acid binding subunit
MRIVTDSAADLLPAEAQEHQIATAALTIHFPDKTISSEDISRDEFYTRLRAMDGQTPTTSQPSVGKFAEIYRELSEKDKGIFSIHISSGLSGTLETSRLGAVQIPQTHIEHIDTLTLSGGQRFQVLAAALAIKAGWDRPAIIDRLHAIQQASEVIFTLDTLHYLARGGRIGRVQAIAGSLLHIKPVIEVDKTDGKYNSIGRVRTLQKGLELICDTLRARFTDHQPLWVTVLHGQCIEQAEALKERLMANLKVERIEILQISPVLGVHTGPGVVGAAAVPIDLYRGLI